MPRAGRGGPLLGDVLAVWDGVRSALPYLEDEAVVTVAGNPKATRRDLYFLACAVGFSLVKRYDIFSAMSPPPSVIMIEWDAAGNSVKFTLKYKTCLATASPVDTEGILNKLTLLAGPPEEVRGDRWHYTGELGLGVGGVGPLAAALHLVPAARALVGGIKPKIPVPNIPFAGRPILTRLPTCDEPDPRKAPGGLIHSPNPRPMGDSRSRGTFYQLVYAALTTPQGAGLKDFPVPAVDTQYSGG